MEKLELKHLAPYLPYELKQAIAKDFIQIEVMNAAHLMQIEYFYHRNDRKPILRPLFDLTKPIIVEGYNDGKEFVPLLRLAALATLSDSVNWIINDNKDAQHKKEKGYLFYVSNGNCDLVLKKSNEWKDFDNISNKLVIYNLLFRWCFDCFNLIESGLAIDINTI